jgi:hypothetical protein
MRPRNRSHSGRGDGSFTARARVSSYGSAAALILAGLLCAALVSGGVGQLLAIGLVGVGLVLVVSLVFMEVGLSEDRERERDRTRLDVSDQARLEPPGRARSAPPAPPHRRSLRPRGLDRQRGERRRLR